jgi:hypothetical protein
VEKFASNVVKVKFDISASALSFFPAHTCKNWPIIIKNSRKSMEYALEQQILLHFCSEAHDEYVGKCAAAFGEQGSTAQCPAVRFHFSFT